jgi:hypothetical protein
MQLRFEGRDEALPPPLALALPEQLELIESGDAARGRALRAAGTGEEYTVKGFGRLSRIAPRCRSGSMAPRTS